MSASRKANQLSGNMSNANFNQIMSVLDAIQVQQTDLIVAVTELKGEITRVDTINGRLIKDVEVCSIKLQGLERAYWKIALAFTLIGAVGAVEAKLLSQILFK